MMMRNDVLFDHCVSNPPYQKDTGSKNNNTANNIFHLFYQQAGNTSSVLTMIFPGGRWMQKSSKGIQAANIIYPTVDKIYWYPNDSIGKVFTNVEIPDGVSIVLSHSGSASVITVNDVWVPRPTGKDILPLSQNAIKIVDSLPLENTIQRRKMPDKFYGLRTYYVERNPDKVSKNPVSGYMKAFLANDNKGTNKRVEEYWLNPVDVTWNDTNRKVFEQYIVCTSGAGIVKNPSGAHYRVINKNILLGESWVIVGSFDTRIEAENYKKYLDSSFVKFLLRESQGGKSRTWGVFVPDLEDYTSSNPNIDWNGSLDKQLCSLFGLDDKQTSYITQ